MCTVVWNNLCHSSHRVPIPSSALCLALSTFSLIEQEPCRETAPRPTEFPYESIQKDTPNSNGGLDLFVEKSEHAATEL